MHIPKNACLCQLAFSEGTPTAEDLVELYEYCISPTAWGGLMPPLNLDFSPKARATTTKG